MDVKKRKKRVKKFFAGFKEFITKGNVIDLAVAVIIGAAFKEIVNVVVEQIIMPPISLLLGNSSLEELVWVIGGTAESPITIGYGLLIQKIIEFLIIAFVIYAVINLVIRRREFIKEADEEAIEEQPVVEEPVVEEPKSLSEDLVLLTEIRDLLKKQGE